MLEGGYSDRALTSGAMAHLAGFLEDDTHHVNPSWWSLENLTAVRIPLFRPVTQPLMYFQLETATKKRRGGRPSQTTPPPPWLARALEIFASIDSSHTLAPLPRAPPPPSDRTLRNRKPANGSARVSPATSPGKKAGAKKGRKSAATAASAEEESDSTDASASGPVAEESEPTISKKLPRVILKLGPAPSD